LWSPRDSGAQPFNHAHGTRGRVGSSHGRRLVLPPGRREGEPGGSGPVLAVAGPAAISEQGAVHRQQPVVDEEEMGGEGEGERHQQQGKGTACGEARLVLSRRHGVAGVHVRASPPESS